jgi:hypothetical protein
MTRRTRRNEAGQVTAFVVIFMVALIFVAGLVIDGGLTLAAKRRAMNEAQAAARAGAQVLDTDAYRMGRVSVLKTDGSPEAAALAYLSKAHPGAAATAQAAGDTVTVDVSFNQPLNILGVAGMGSVTVDGHGSARTAHGITRENG